MESVPVVKGEVEGRDDGEQGFLHHHESLGEVVVRVVIEVFRVEVGQLAFDSAVVEHPPLLVDFLRELLQVFEHRVGLGEQDVLELLRLAEQERVCGVNLLFAFFEFD